MASGRWHVGQPTGQFHGLLRRVPRKRVGVFHHRRRRRKIRQCKIAETPAQDGADFSGLVGVARCDEKRGHVEFTLSGLPWPFNPGLSLRPAGPAGRTPTAFQLRSRRGEAATISDNQDGGAFTGAATALQGDTRRKKRCGKFITLGSTNGVEELVIKMFVSTVQKIRFVEV